MLGSTEEGARPGKPDRGGGLWYRPGEGEEEAEGQGGETGARTGRGTELEEHERVRGRDWLPVEGPTRGTGARWPKEAHRAR